MIYATQDNKIKSEIRAVFKASEDSLTSSVFEVLVHLPTELIWKLLSQACFNSEILNCGKLQSFEFWPRWSAEGTSNKRDVEPDLFLRFEFADVIIEAKRYDEKQQDSNQWYKEFRAYLNEYEEDEKLVFMLAVGGIRNKEVETLNLTYNDQDKTCEVYKIHMQKPQRPNNISKKLNKNKLPNLKIVHPKK